MFLSKQLSVKLTKLHGTVSFFAQSKDIKAYFAKFIVSIVDFLLWSVYVK